MKSEVKKLMTIDIPSYTGILYMKEFLLDDLSSIPSEFQSTIKKMVSSLNIKKGKAYLTIDGKKILKDNSHRREGAHIDGIWEPKGGWDDGGWNNISMHGTPPPRHSINPFEVNGGIILASDYTASKGWNGEYDIMPGDGGDCSKHNLSEGFIMEKNNVYFGNSTFIHESLPINEDVHRTLIRISFPKEFKYKVA